MYYKTEITAQTDAIADHLTIRVVSMEDNSVLYEGKLSAFCGQELAISVNKNEQNVTIQDFRIEPVSYTHLDVYKRQDHPGVFFFPGYPAVDGA